tara:strand:- start:719 stop:2620 length:1902 start_codon:yes stop_codon:yes gene_type:complete
MSIASSRVETRIVVNTETGQAVKGLSSVKKSVRGVGRATRRAAKDTHHLKRVTEDYNKTAEKGGKDTKEVLEGVRDMLGNQLGPEISAIATGFGGIEKVARTLPGPIGLIAAAVAAVGAGVYLLQTRTQKASTALMNAFGSERLAEVKAISDDLGISADSMIEVQKAADLAGMSSMELHEELKGVVSAAEATGKDGSAAVSKFATTITKTRLPVIKLLKQLQAVNQEASKLPTIASLATGTSLEKDAAGADKFLKSSRADVGKEMARRRDVMLKAEKRVIDLRAKARKGDREAAKAMAAAIAEETRQAARYNEIKKVSVGMMHREQQLRDSVREVAREQAIEVKRLADEELRANDIASKIAIATKRREVAAKAAARAAAARKRGLARKRAIEASLKREQDRAFQESQAIQQAQIRTITTKIDALGKGLVKERERLEIVRESIRRDKELQDIKRSGIAVTERLAAAEQESALKMHKIRGQAKKDLDDGAKSSMESRFAIASAAAQGAASLIESERASAGIMALMSAAEAWRNIGSGNIPGAIASGVAAAQYALVAGTGKPTLPGTGGEASPDRPTFTGARPTTSTGAEPSGAGGVVNVTFGKGFIIGSPQTVGQAINGAVQSLSGTGYGQKAGV